MMLAKEAADHIRRVAHENDTRVSELIQVAIAALNLFPLEPGRQRHYNIETGEITEDS